METTLRPSTARVARGFHAASDETRLQILAVLGAGERCVCDLTAALDVAQSRLSFHLKALKAAGLVRDRRAGRWVYYSVNREALDDMIGALEELRPAPGVAEPGGRCCE